MHSISSQLIDTVCTQGLLRILAQLEKQEQEALLVRCKETGQMQQKLPLSKERTKSHYDRI